MPAPRLIADAERDVHRAVIAARNLGADATHGLQQAETLMAEVRHFAYSASETRCLGLSEDASRLLSAILGFEVKVTAVSVGFNHAEAYARLAR
jgi:hypothetical protein